jgi:hypothetical protein
MKTRLIIELLVAGLLLLAALGAILRTVAD